MMNPSETAKLRKHAPLPCIITAIMLLAPAFVVKPQLENLAQTENSMDATLSVVRNSITQNILLSDSQAKLDKIRLQLKNLDRRLHTKDNMPELIDQLNSLATIFGLTVESVVYSFDKPHANNRIPSIQFNLSIKGAYNSLRNFIQSLEGLAAPVFLTEIVAKSGESFSLILTYMVKE